MNYTETLDYLFGRLTSFQDVGAAAYKPGLERMTAFSRQLGNPHRHFFSVHVAGTNGKGSVAHIIASVLQQAGYRTGLFTSPHLHDFRERIRVDGEMIPKQRVVNFIDKHLARIEEGGLSFFEVCTAMAFDHFDQSEVEVAVLETGLGGRLDATNIVTPMLSVVTNISYDHTDLLGTTLPQIAREKAGIIKKSVPVVVGEHGAESDPVLTAAAAALSSPLSFAQEGFRLLRDEPTEERRRFTLCRLADGRIYTVELDLAGDYQRRNIITATAALDTLHRSTPLSISTRAYLDGCRDAARMTGLRGRWEVIGHDPLTLCDTGHNADGLRLVAEQLAALPCRRLYMVFGVVADKDLDAILPLLPRRAYYLFTDATTPRALPATELARRAVEAGLTGEPVPGVREALARAREMAGSEDAIFVGGSTFTVADLC